MESENPGLGSQLRSHCCVTLGKPLVSPLSLLSLRFSFLPAFVSFSLSLYFSSLQIAQRGGEEEGFRSQIGILVSLPTSWVALGKSLKFPMPQFPRL